MPGPAYISALRTAYDTLLDHMATEGEIPMTDDLADAIAVVEAHDANAPLRNMSPLSVRVPALPRRERVEDPRAVTHLRTLAFAIAYFPLVMLVLLALVVSGRGGG